MPSGNSFAGSQRPIRIKCGILFALRLAKFKTNNELLSAASLGMHAIGSFYIENARQAGRREWNKKDDDQLVDQIR
jgi:hypothetical protein